MVSPVWSPHTAAVGHTRALAKQWQQTVQTGTITGQLRMKTRISPIGSPLWDDAADNIVEHVAGVDDFETAVATYRAALSAMAGSTRWRCSVGRSSPIRSSRATRQKRSMRSRSDVAILSANAGTLSRDRPAGRSRALWLKSIRPALRVTGDVGIAEGISSFGQTCWRASVEDLYETGQHRLHLIDLPLLVRNYLTAKFLDFRILDGCPFTHENSPRMVRNHRR